MTGWRPSAFASHMHKLIISLLESFTMLTAHIVKITASRKLVAKQRQRCCKRATATVHALFSSSRIPVDVIFSLACEFGYWTSWVQVTVSQAPLDHQCCHRWTQSTILLFVFMIAPLKLRNLHTSSMALQWRSQYVSMLADVSVQLKS